MRKASRQRYTPRMHLLRGVILGLTQGSRMLRYNIARVKTGFKVPCATSGHTQIVFTLKENNLCVFRAGYNETQSIKPIIGN
jgi:hypothetical protein